MTRILALSVVLLFSSQAAFALEGGYVGGGLGYSDVSLEDFDGSVSLSGRVGMVFTPNFALGLGLSSYSKSETAGSVESSISIIPILVEANYHIMTPVDGPYIGAAVGFVSETLTIERAGIDYTTSDTESGFGLQAGYNFALAEKHSLGGELRYLAVDGDPKDYSFTGLTVMYNFWW